MTLPSATWNLKSHLLAGSLILTLVGGAIALQAQLDLQRPAASRATELIYLPKGEYLRVAVLGYRQLVADLIWLRVVQHIGLRNQTIDGYRWAYHAGDVLTDLDPQFVHAYQALGTVLAISAQQIDESISLLKKGMRHNPEAWVLPFLLGYAYYFERHDPGTASTYFQAAASLPGSPKYLPELAAKMTIEAGDPDAALEFLQRLYAQVPDERIREGLARRIKEVVVERDLRFLEEGIRRYRARSNKLPKKLEDLVTGGIINRIPDEPFGERYQLNETEGTVNSLALEKRFRLHRK